MTTNNQPTPTARAVECAKDIEQQLMAHLEAAILCGELRAETDVCYITYMAFVMAKTSIPLHYPAPASAPDEGARPEPATLDVDDEKESIRRAQLAYDLKVPDRYILITGEELSALRSELSRLQSILEQRNAENAETLDAAVKIETERNELRRELSRLKSKTFTFEEDENERLQLQAELSRVTGELAEAKKDGERLSKLETYLSDDFKNIGQPCEGDPSRQFGYNAGMFYQVDGQGDSLREAIDSLPDAACTPAQGETKQ